MQTHTAMVICPHADDAAAFCGGTVARFAAEGWRIVLVRVTNDSRDSADLSEEETIRRNTQELHEAAALLGVGEIVELGYETDALADVPKVPLRERFVRLFRAHRPYAVFSFDPFGMYEGNMDHIVTAQAVEEAYWVSCFHLHHPEHLEQGLQPYSVCERWYFGRDLPGANYAMDITEYLEQNTAALCAHRTMLRHMLQQMRMQADSWGRQSAALDHAFHEDPGPLAEMFLRARAEAVAERFQLEPGRLAEAFRLVRFGDLEPLMQSICEPLPGRPLAPRRPGLDL